jgi:EEF1A N-terminal glycine/lysine methyltransferase
MTSDDGALAGDTDLFDEPHDYYLPEKPPTFVQHTLLSGQELQLRLVGHSPLWV